MTFKIKKSTLSACALVFFLMNIMIGNIYGQKVVTVVKDIYPGTFGLTNNLIQVGNTMFFIAYTAETGEELWKSDGTAEGTVIVTEIKVGTTGGSISDMTNVNGTLFFSANNQVNGSELWKSDGTAEGTVMVKDINTGSANGWPNNLTNINGTLYFMATTSATGYELWKSDGTEVGTVMIKDLFAGTSGSSPGDFTEINGKVYFAAYTNIGGALWKTDGTANGTEVVKDINSGTAAAGGPSNLSVLNNKLYFMANDGVVGDELWESDGTNGGTALVKDIKSGPIQSSPGWAYNMVSKNGALYFTADNGVNGFELWKSDGTTSGTVMLKDINAGSASGFPTSFQSVGSLVYFSTTDGLSGIELWKTDGTTLGTAIVKDINPGTGDSSPSSFTNIGGVLYFTANDGTNGQEIWTSDGSENGTTLFADTDKTPGVGGYPNSLTYINNTLYFIAGLPTYGRELYRLGEKQTQIITFGAITDKNLSDKSFTLTATASSNLVVSFSVVSGPATIEDGKITISGPGIVKVKASQDGNDDYLVAVPVEQSFNVLPNPEVVSSAICGPGAVILTASGSTAGNYRWYTAVSGGTAISGAVNGTYTTEALTATTTYFVAISNGSYESQRIAVVAEIKSGPSTPVINMTESGATLTLMSNTLTGNQWYRNGEIIPGATNQTLQLHEGGSYAVKVTLEGCSAESAPTVLTGAENPLIGDAIKVYPNPVVNKIMIANPSGKKGSVRLYDILGKLRTSRALESNAEFDLSGLESGIYTLEIESDGNKFLKRIIKTKN